MKIVKEWPVTLRVTELADGRTEAELVLTAERWKLDRTGQARRNPGDVDAAAIGDRLAVGRALVAMGESLIRLAELDAEVREFHALAWPA